MKQWFSNVLLSLKHGTHVLKEFFSWKVAILYVALYVQWMLTPFETVWHFLFTLFVVTAIDGLSFANGVECERLWSQQHPKQ